jgi:peptidoglycan hydrolase CwlO-like protein
MNHPNVPVPESRSRRVGYLPAFQRTAIFAAVVLTAPFAAAVNPVLNTDLPRAATPGGAVSPEIAAAQKKVNDLSARLHALQVQLSDLKAKEPAQSDKAHGAWQQQVDKLQHQIDSVKQQLAAAEKELQALKAKAAQGGH